MHCGFYDFIVRPNWESADPSTCAKPYQGIVPSQWQGTLFYLDCLLWPTKAPIFVWNAFSGLTVIIPGLGSSIYG